MKKDTPNAETRKAIADVMNGIGLSREFTSVKELFEDLNGDDETTDLPLDEAQN